MTGAELLARTLAEVGFTRAFGLPGTQNAELFTLLPRFGVRPVLATHEASAAFMANGYARTAGEPALVMTIPGPGLTFALPGVAEARLDSVPLLLVTGSPAGGDGRRFQHQAIDQASIAGPLVKAVVDVQDAGHLPRSIRRAHALTVAGEPGPVVVQLSRGALGQRPATDGAEASTPAPAREDGTVGATGNDPPPWESALLDLVRKARRPVLFVGAGACRGADLVRRLVEAWPAPVFTTLSGRGIVPEDHPLCLAFDADRGRLGALNDLLAESDLILALGCKLSHNGTAGFGLVLPPGRLVQVNTDPAALGANYGAALLVEADAGLVIERVLREVAAGSGSAWNRAEIERSASLIRAPDEHGVPEPRLSGVEGSRARNFFGALRGALPRDGVVVTDSGLHQVLTRRHLDVLTPGGLLAPSDFQSMGFGIPAAIGAALAAPARPVVAVVGDGGFLMTAMDLLVAAREGITLPVVVFNDGRLNLIRLQQLRESGRGTAVDLRTPDLEGMARSLSIGYRRIDGDTGQAITAALAAPGPTLVELRVSDSAAIHGMRARGFTRSVARRTLGPRLVERLKGLLGH